MLVTLCQAWFYLYVQNSYMKRSLQFIMQGGNCRNRAQERFDPTCSPCMSRVSLPCPAIQTYRFSGKRLDGRNLC